MSQPANAFEASAAEKRLLALQQELRSLKIPVVVLLEGWNAAGKGLMAGELLEGLDPRGYQVYVPERIHEEPGFPPLHRYWVRMPRQGNLSLFIGSWYHDVCARLVSQEDGLPSDPWTSITQMERMLCCDGVLLLKFFLHIPQKEQKRRLKAMEEKKPPGSWFPKRIGSKTSIMTAGRPYTTACCPPPATAARPGTFCAEMKSMSASSRCTKLS